MRSALKGGEHKLFVRQKLFEPLVSKPLQNFLPVDSVSENLVILRNSYEFKLFQIFSYLLWEFLLFILDIVISPPDFHDKGFTCSCTPNFY